MTSSPLSPSSNAGSRNTRPRKPGRKLQPRRSRCRASMPARSQRSATRWRSAQTRRAIVLQNFQECGKPASSTPNPYSFNLGKSAIRIWFGTVHVLQLSIQLVIAVQREEDLEIQDRPGRLVPHGLEGINANGVATAVEDAEGLAAFHVHLVIGPPL